MRWIRAHDPAGRVLALPSQTPGILDRYGLTRAQANCNAWTIEPNGRERAGAAAINRVLEELGGVWKSLAAAYRLPPFRWLEDRLYRWVARHRHWLSSIWGAAPECEQPGIECE